MKEIKKEEKKYLLGALDKFEYNHKGQKIKGVLNKELMAHGFRGIVEHIKTGKLTILKKRPKIRRTVIILLSIIVIVAIAFLIISTTKDKSNDASKEQTEIDTLLSETDVEDADITQQEPTRISEGDISKVDRLKIKPYQERIEGKTTNFDILVHHFDTEKGRKAIFVHLHRNEPTALTTALKLGEEKDISVITIVDPHYPNSKDRYGKVNYKGYSYRFDPNGMFTIEGAKRSLKRYNTIKNSIADAIAPQIHELGKKVIEQLEDKEIIIAFHNNMNTPIQNFLNLYNVEGHVNPNQNPKNLFYVTDENYYDLLKQKGYNVLLQKDTYENDGSLSYWAQINNKKYINLEVETYHDEENLKLARIAYNVMLEELTVS